MHLDIGNDVANRGSFADQGRARTSRDGVPRRPASRGLGRRGAAIARWRLFRTRTRRGSAALVRRARCACASCSADGAQRSWRRTRPVGTGSCKEYDARRRAASGTLDAAADRWPPRVEATPNVKACTQHAASDLGSCELRSRLAPYRRLVRAESEARRSRAVQEANCCRKPSQSKSFQHV